MRDVENQPTSTYTSPDQLSVESPLRQFSVDQLHEGLVRYENEELVYDRPEQYPTIDIVDNHSIEVKNRRIKLTDLRVFMLNALRLNQGYAMTAEDFIDYGFRGKPSTLRINLQWLMRAMDAGGDETFIEQEQPTANGKAFYTLLPEVRIVDRRDELQETTAERLLRECGAVDADGTVRVGENGGIEFAAPRFRARTTLAMIDDYREHAKIDYAVAQLFDLRMGRRGPSDSILPVRRDEPYNPEEGLRIVATKEHGLLTYLQVSASKEQPTEQQRETIIAGVLACYEFFAHNMDLLAKHARMVSKRYAVPYHELYQEAAMQLMDAVITESYDNTGMRNFRFIATEIIKRSKGRGLYPICDFYRQPVNYPLEYHKDFPKFQEAAEVLEAELGRTPSAAEIAERIGSRVDKVLGMMALSATAHSLDYSNGEDPEDEGRAPRQLFDDDFTDELLDHMERQAAIEHVFDSNELTTAEKVVLSMFYGIFQQSLCGTVIKEKEKTYRYPETQRDFILLTMKQRTFQSLSLDIFGFNEHFAVDRHKKALRKARTLLEADDGFDTYGRVDTKEAQQAFQKEEIERREIVTYVLALNPERLGKKEIRALYKAGDLPYNERHLVKLFGTIASFQEACGLEPDKRRPNQDISADAVIKIALQLKPDGPLAASEVRDLSKQGKFPGYSIVMRLFGSMPAFKEACRQQADRDWQM